MEGSFTLKIDKEPSEPERGDVLTAHNTKNARKHYGFVGSAVFFCATQVNLTLFSKVAQGRSNPYRNPSRYVNNNAIPILALPLQCMYTYGSAKNFTANADSPILLSHLHACRYTHTHTHTHILSHLHACRYTRTPNPSLTFGYIHTHYAHIHACTHACIHAHTQCTHTQAHTYTHAHVPTEIFVPRKVCQRWFVTANQICTSIQPLVLFSYPTLKEIMESHVCVT